MGEVILNLNYFKIFVFDDLKDLFVKEYKLQEEEINKYKRH